ncbi:LOW QUALITY PROTEIN: coiled-coil domain-containing protein 102B [Rhynchocyon petersi]
MNLDSIHRFLADAQSFQMQRSSLKSLCDTEVPASSLEEPCSSHLPLHGLRSHVVQNVCAHSHSTSEWDLSKELRLRELEEVKARAAQMEKTMRWWSDCTANWREKWSKVRAERNSAREEGRQLRIKLEMTMKELSALKKKQRWPQGREASALEGIQDLKQSSFLEEPFQVGSQTRECLIEKSRKENTDKKEEDGITDASRINKSSKLHVDCSDFFSEDSPGSSGTTSELRFHTVSPPSENKVPEMSALQMSMSSDDFETLLWKEREMRLSLEKEVERLQSALSLWKWKYEELRAEKTPPPELERMQADKTLVWDKREILETEKQGLERENRRLKVQVELEELLDRRNQLSANCQDPDFKTSQRELQGKTKEWVPLETCVLRALSSLPHAQAASELPSHLPISKS